MQHTEKYQLNLIEPNDPFLPDALNQNTRQMENVMSAHEARVDGQTAAQDRTISAIVKNLGAAGKNLRIEWGSYTGTGEYGEDHPNKLTFSLIPVVVVVAEHYNSITSDSTSIMLRDSPIARGGGSGPVMVSWKSKEISWYNDQFPSAQHNIASYIYRYIAFGYDEE